MKTDRRACRQPTQPQVTFLSVWLGPVCLAMLSALVACGNAGSSAVSATAVTSTAPSAASDGQAEWNKTMAAAKQEGKVSVVAATGDPFRQVFDDFQKATGIAVELLQGNGTPDLVPRITTERQAGQFLWDVAVISQAPLYRGLKPTGALEPLQPALLLPDALDDSKWAGGFAAGWGDLEKAYVYAFVAIVSPNAYVNRDVIPDAQLNTFDQLWDPQWKGKIVMQDPSVSSRGSATATSVLVTRGEEKLRALLQQQPVVSQDRRQVAEFLVRGRNPIGIAADETLIKSFADQGVSVTNIKALTPADPTADIISAGTGAVSLFNRAPHPNAARVLVNWLLSREGQKDYTDRTGANVRRTDIPATAPELAVDPAKASQYVRVDIEQNEGANQKAISLAKEMLKA